MVWRGAWLSCSLSAYGLGVLGAAPPLGSSVVSHWWEEGFEPPRNKLRDQGSGSWFPPGWPQPF